MLAERDWVCITPTHHMQHDRQVPEAGRELYYSGYGHTQCNQGTPGQGGQKTGERDKDMWTFTHTHTHVQKCSSISSKQLCLLTNLSDRYAVTAHRDQSRCLLSPQEYCEDGYTAIETQDAAEYKDKCTLLTNTVFSLRISHTEHVRLHTQHSIFKTLSPPLHVNHKMTLWYQWLQ